MTRMPETTTAIARRDELPAQERLRYLDNLKVGLIAGIIAVHAALSYTGMIEVWSYTGVREATYRPVVEVALLVLVAPFGLLLIPLLFLVAGLLTPPSVRRKGTGRFARDRLLRLGVPFLVYVLLVQPAVMYALEHPLGSATRSYWYEMLGADKVLDTGPLWFVGVLLIFSLVYAAWARRWPRATSREPGRITARGLLLLVAAIAPLSFLVRLVYPYGGNSGFTDLNFWEWPGCAALFWLGIAASRQGWLTGIPDRLRRVSRIVTLVALGAMTALMLTAGMLDKIDDMLGGWHPLALGFAVIESFLVVFGPVALLGATRRHLDRPLPWAGPAARRSAYAAFMVQTPVLIALAVALRPLPLPAEAKVLLLAPAGVAASFALAWLLISRVPGVARIL